MKRIIALFLVLLMALSFVACNKNDDTDTNTNTSIVDIAPKDNLYEYNMSELFTLPNYKDLQINIKLDDIQAYIDQEISNNATEEYKIQKGDDVYVDVSFYTYESNGFVEIKDLEKKNFLIENLGEGSYLAELENMLIGTTIQKAGSSYSSVVELTLPTDFYLEEWRGKDVRVYGSVVSKACKLGDVVEVDYTGYYIDQETLEVIKDVNGAGKVFDSETNVRFFIGSKTAIEDFEKGLENARVNERVSFNATFPNDYIVDDLKGETVKFEVTVTKIFTPPAYNDEYVKEFFDFDTTEEYENSVKKDFIKSKLYDYIFENSTARYPLAEYNKQLQNLEDMAESFEEKNNYSIDEYLQTVFGKTRDEYVKHTLKSSMLYYAIAQAEKIEPSKAQLDAEKNELIAYYYNYYISLNYAQSEAEKTANELVNDLGNAYVYEQVIIELVKKHMVDNAKVSYTEKTYTSISEATNN